MPITHLSPTHRPLLQWKLPDDAIYHDDGHRHGQHGQGDGQDEPGHEGGGRPQNHAAVREGEHTDGDGRLDE